MNRRSEEFLIHQARESIHQPSAKAIERLIENRIERLKDELVTASAEKTAQLQGAVQEMRNLLRDMRPPENIGKGAPQQDGAYI